MAEDAGDPPSEKPLADRIKEWVASPKGRAAFEEGFASQSQFLSLQDFKERESRGERFALYQGKFLEGGAAGKTVAVKVHPQCRKEGHDWREADNALLSICLRCGIQINGKPPPVEVEGDEDVGIERICIWCGKVCDDLEALGIHEDECAPD